MKKKQSEQESNELAANLVARSELMLAVVESIKEKGWTQAEAANFLGVAQPRISDVAQGRVDRFSADMLMFWLQKLGKDVSVVVRDNVFSTVELTELTLYVCGTPTDLLLDNVARLFGGDSTRYKLTVVDVLKDAQRATRERITSTPCLVKEFPSPKIIFYGDMSAPSVRWQLANADRLSADTRQVAQDLRQASQDQRELDLSAREERLNRRQSKNSR